VNLLTAVDLPVFMVGMDLRLRRLTAAAEGAFGLSGEDLNRPVSILRPFFPTVDLDRACRQVIDRLIPTQQEVLASDGRWFELRIRPYRTVDHVIGGAVISFSPIARGPTRQDADQVAPLSLIPSPVLVLDDRFRVLWANEPAGSLLGVGKATLIGSDLGAIGSGQVSGPQLRGALEELSLAGKGFADLRVGKGQNELRVHGIRLPRAEDGEARMVLFVDRPRSDA
jgi:two-component system CheB/CheR fusion protein